MLNSSFTAGRLQCIQSNMLWLYNTFSISIKNERKKGRRKKAMKILRRCNDYYYYDFPFFSFPFLFLLLLLSIFHWRCILMSLFPQPHKKASAVVYSLSTTFGDSLSHIPFYQTCDDIWWLKRNRLQTHIFSLYGWCEKRRDFLFLCWQQKCWKRRQRWKRLFRKITHSWSTHNACVPTANEMERKKIKRITTERTTCRAYGNQRDRNNMGISMNKNERKKCQRWNGNSDVRKFIMWAQSTFNKMCVVRFKSMYHFIILISSKYFVFLVQHRTFRFYSVATFVTALYHEKSHFVHWLIFPKSFHVIKLWKENNYILKRLVLNYRAFHREKRSFNYKIWMMLTIRMNNIAYQRWLNNSIGR